MGRFRKGLLILALPCAGCLNIYGEVEEHSFWNPYIEVKGTALKCEKSVSSMGGGYSGEATYKWGWSGSIEIGTVYNDLRFALESLYAKIKMKKFHVGNLHFESYGATCKSETFSGLFDIYYDRILTDQLDLYLGAGAGLARVEEKLYLPNTIPAIAATLNLKEHVTKFVWQIMVGMTYYFNENWALKGGYRFFKIQSKNFADTHCLEIGLRYTF